MTGICTLFIFSLIFLMVVSIHFSVVNSRLKDQIRDLTQEIGLLREEIEERGDVESGGAGDSPGAD